MERKWLPRIEFYQEKSYKEKASTIIDNEMLSSQLTVAHERVDMHPYTH